MKSIVKEVSAKELTCTAHTVASSLIVPTTDAIKVKLIGKLDTKCGGTDNLAEMSVYPTEQFVYKV